MARAQPGTLSIPTASIAPVAALAEPATSLSATRARSQDPGGWLAQGATLGSRRASQITARRELAAPATPTFGPATPRVAPSGTADWYAIAACESGGRWDLNSGNGFWGGLQFLPSTWFAYGGGAFDGVGQFPYSAGEQIAVAERVLAGQGPGAWPNCFRWA